MTSSRPDLLEGQRSMRVRHACIAAHDFRAGRGEGEEFRMHDFVVETLKGLRFQLKIRAKDPRYYVKEHIHVWR